MVITNSQTILEDNKNSKKLERDDTLQEIKKVGDVLDEKSNKSSLQNVKKKENSNKKGIVSTND